jgi:hypothetical protein
MQALKYFAVCEQDMSATAIAEIKTSWMDAESDDENEAITS